MTTKADWLPAYTATVYRVLASAGYFDLQLEKAYPDAWLSYLSCRKYYSFALITADNPTSRIETAAVNAIRQAELLAVIRQQGVDYLPTEHHAGSGDWPVERGWCVFNIAQPLASAWAAQFEQNAWVYGESLDATLRLCWTRDV